MTEKSYCKFPSDEDDKNHGGLNVDRKKIIDDATPAVRLSDSATTDKEKWRLCHRPGWKWFILLGAFIIRGTVGGFLSNYTMLSVKLREVFGSSEELTGWVGSLLLSMRCFSSPITTSVVVKIGYRSTIFIGIIICSSCLMVSSFVKDLRWYFVTLSVMYGIGMSLCTFSSYDYLMSYFHKQFIRGAGLMAVSTSVGLMVFAPLMESLQESVGLENTLRVFAGIILFICIFAFTFRPSPAEKRGMSVIQISMKEKQLSDPDQEVYSLDQKDVYKPPVHQKKTFSESVSVYAHLLKLADMWILGGISITICLASTFTYLNMVSFLNSIGLSVKTSAFTLSMMGVGEFGGTAFSTLLGDRIPLLKMEILAIICLLAAVVTAAFTVVTTYPGVLALVIGMGVCRSMYNLLVFPTVIETIGKDQKLEGCSISSFMCGIGYLPGGMIGGALYDATGSYVCSLLVCTFLYLVAVLLLVWGAYRFRRAKKVTAEMCHMVDKQGNSKETYDKDTHIVEAIISTV